MIGLTDLVKPREQYDTGRKRSGKSGPSGKAYNNLRRPILAIDGEGVTDKNGAHRYIMLAGSDGSYVSGHMLTTVECFEYLLSLPRNHLIVGFSLNYDVCKWLQFVKRDVLEKLWKDGQCLTSGYSIRWAPSKFIDIKHIATKRHVRVYDVFGFYQHSFVASLEEWQVGTLEQVERIRAMKASRSVFGEESFDEILAYCLEECRLLVQLVGKLRKALIEGEIPIEQWYGAGAIAAAIFKKEGVKAYIGRQDEKGRPQGPPKQYSEAILSAYFGGRFELYQSGEHHDVYSYDIRSAYPAIATTLPCLTHALYRLERGYEKAEWALYHVRWHVLDGTPWPPFPYRVAGTRQIIYPTSGEGWYHSSELHAAKRLFPTEIEVLETLVLDLHCPSSCDGRPFAFIPRYYEFRNILKKRGSQAQLTIKLGLNSLYGKMAQGVGWGEKRPPYQSYLWAGMVTAGTRAMLLDAIAQNPEEILWTATDGIVSSAPLELDVGEELGQWEAGQYAAAFSVQSGVYETWEGIPYAKQTKSRGFGKAETSFDQIRQAWQRDAIGGTFSYETTRFVGLGAALARTEFWRYFGRWIQMQRAVNFYQNKRWPEHVFHVLGEPTRHNGVVRWYPPEAPDGQEASAPFQPRSSWVDLWQRESSEETLELLIDADQP